MSKNFAGRVLRQEAGLLAPLEFRNDVRWRRTHDLRLSRFRDVVAVDLRAEDGSDEEEEDRIPGNHSSTVTSLDLEGQEGRYLLAGCADGSIYIHDLANFRGEPRCSSKLIGHLEPILPPPPEQPRTSIPSARRPEPAARSNRNTNGHFQGVETVQWYPGDSGLFITSGLDQRLLVWDANSLRIAEEFPIRRTVFCHQMSQPPSTLVAVASASSHVRLIDLKSGSSTHELRGHNGELAAFLSSRTSSITFEYNLPHPHLSNDLLKKIAHLVSIPHPGFPERPH